MIFDLTTQPWLPVVDLSGTPRQASLTTVLTEAHTLRRIVGETPPMTAALHRLVLALAHRAYGPPDDDDWRKLWDGAQLPGGPLTSYLAMHPGRFNLFDPERPFFQCPAVASATASSAAKLVPHRAAGNNTTLFDHTTADDELLLAPAEAARWLVTLQAYDTGGLKTAYRKEKSSQQAPCNRIGVVLLEGGNLKETLLLNLLRYRPGNWPGGTSSDDRPVWEDEPPAPEPVQRPPRGWTDQLTWPSRRVWLSHRPESGTMVVDKVVITPGDRPQKEDEPDDWMAAYRRSWLARKKTYTPWRAVRLENLKGIWRHSAEFLLAPSNEKVQQRPDTLVQVAERADRECPLRGAVYTLRAFGQQLDRNGGMIEQVLEESVAAPIALLREREDTAAGQIIGHSVKLAEECGDALGAMAADYGRAFLAKPPSELELAYWPRLPEPFDEFLWMLGEAVDRGASLEPATRMWSEQVRRIADGAAQQWAEGSPGWGRHVEAAGKVYGRFGRQLRRHLAQYRGEIARYIPT